MGIGLALTLVMLVVEAVGGWWSGSLALLADAGHMLVDAMALGLAVAGARITLRPPSARYSFGLARGEVLAGFFNAMTQFALVGFIAWEALQRLLRPHAIASGEMLAIALVGLMINVLVLRLLHRHDADDVNMAAASLHVLGDLLGSVATVLAALAVGLLGWLWADPVLSLLVSLLLLRSAWVLVRRSAHILLEGVPEGVNAEVLLAELRGLDSAIVDVHHLHLWQVGAGQRMATLHVRVARAEQGERMLRLVQTTLAERFGIRHATVQIESAGCVETGPNCAAR
ncbi:cation diffusion facilitator family transporter [Metallibacterium sp.]|uniref:cation diffusion facilitator family transporter n=1 Tax=Metallibacterium sp. TaxID=2940281 RepID=UPI00261F2D2B|nr:cation diffusion facilitator family transporter [Metallibacterium sp.]